MMICAVTPANYLLDFQALRHKAKGDAVVLLSRPEFSEIETSFHVHLAGLLEK